MTITNKTLVKIAAIGGVITCSMGLLMQWKIKDRIRQTDYYREAFKILRKHAGAVSLLGEPIKDGDIKFSDANTCLDKEKAHFTVNCKGSQQTGKLFIWANKQVESEKWIVSRLELGLEKESDRRLLIKKTIEQNKL